MAGLGHSKRLQRLAENMLLDPSMPAIGACRLLLQTIDVLQTIRGVEGTNAVKRSQILRATRHPAEVVDAVLRYLSTYRLIHKVEGGVNPSIAKKMGRGLSRSPECYAAVGRRPPLGYPKVVAWDGTVLDISIRESLVWDIYEMVERETAALDYSRASGIVKKLRRYRLPDGTGEYGAEGVHAHIKAMQDWDYLEVLGKDETRKRLGGPPSSGPLPILLIPGRRALRLAGRARAHPWAQVKDSSELPESIEERTAREKRLFKVPLSDESGDNG